MFYSKQKQNFGAYNGNSQPVGSSIVSALQNNPAQQQPVNQPSPQMDPQGKGFLAMEAQNQLPPPITMQPQMPVGNNPIQPMQNGQFQMPYNANLKR
jgi:hypothetical protein